MRNVAIFVVFFSVSVGFYSVSSGVEEEQWLSYRTSPEAYRVVGNMTMRRLEVITDKPEQVELPEFKGDSPLFAKWESPMVKGGFLWVVLDREHKYGSYDRIVIDSNGDGHLNDEKFIASHRIESRYSYFGPAPVYFEGEDGPITYHLNFRLYYREDYKYLYVSSGGWYEGTIRLGEEKMHCTLIDYNGDGEFNDSSQSAAASDRIRVGKTEHAPVRYVGKYLEIDGVLYRPTIARDGAFLTISKADDVEFGSIRVPGEITELTAGGLNGLLTVTLENGVGKLPVGQYRLDHWEIDRKDDNDRNWTMRGSRFGKEGDFEVSQDSSFPLAIGEPVLANLEVQKTDTKYSFNHQMRGQLNERIEILQNGSRAQAPKLQIVNGDQTYNRTFQLEYG